MTFATLTREGISLADSAGLKYSLGSGRPTTLRKFAEDLGIDRVELKEMDEDAMLVKRPDGISLLLNREHPKVRHRFSMAHELAHLLLEPVIGDRAIHRRRFVPHQDPDGQKIEEICNRMASAMLMPKNGIEQILQRRGYTAKCVPEIARSFQVSFEAAGRRYLSVVPKPSAMLFFRRNRNGGIQQVRR
ncbi:MAG: ImmA/IrrE family metallo-endopeptidase, partial [Candidatus Marinimicrobia bacterium]|nr:ImmA/IrrE family metallo-endopeptidase [Candidatus Neomarinimicrobiota bacterium]